MSVHVADTAPRQGPLATYAEAAASAGPVNTPVHHSVSRRRPVRRSHVVPLAGEFSFAGAALETIIVVNMTGVGPSS